MNDLKKQKIKSKGANENLVWNYFEYERKKVFQKKLVEQKLCMNDFKKTQKIKSKGANGNLV